MHPQQTYVKLAPLCGGDNAGHNPIRFDEYASYPYGGACGHETDVVLTQAAVDCGDLLIRRIRLKTPFRVLCLRPSCFIPAGIQFFVDPSQDIPTNPSLGRPYNLNVLWHNEISGISPNMVRYGLRTGNKPDLVLPVRNVD